MFPFVGGTVFCALEAFRWPFRTAMGLAGRFQAANGAVALAAAEQLQADFPQLDAAAAIQGLAEARWPCRAEPVLADPPVFIDVAHNVAGARRLAEMLTQCTVILAVSSDKDAAGIVKALAPVAAPLRFTKIIPTIARVVTTPRITMRASF